MNRLLTRNFHKDTLYCFSDIRGNFEVLVKLLTVVMKVATFESNTWLWIAQDTTVVCLGNFVDRFTNADNDILTKTAITNEIKIVKCFISLQQQATIRGNNSQFVVLVGKHEMGSIHDLKEYRKFQVANPGNAEEIYSRQQKFVRPYLIPFVQNEGKIVVSWANFVLMHGGLETNWVKRHKFTSVHDINDRWERYHSSRNRSPLQKIFMEPDSIIHSRKMSLNPEAWYENDRAKATLLISVISNPKFIISHTPKDSLDNLEYRDTQYSGDGVCTIRTLKDIYGDDVVFYLGTAITPDTMNSNYQNKASIDHGIPRVLQIQSTTDNNSLILYTTNATKIMTYAEADTFYEKYNPVPKINFI
jgi:hypothetical protein